MFQAVSRAAFREWFSASKVSAGDTLLVLEAMKMENPVVSPVDGTVTEIFVEEGAVVQSGDVLVVVK